MTTSIPPCELHVSCPATTAAVRRYLQAHLEDHRDPLTGEVNHTALAEDASYYFDHDGWLDDELSPIWDLALEEDSATRGAD